MTKKLLIEAHIIEVTNSRLFRPIMIWHKAVLG